MPRGLAVAVFGLYVVAAPPGFYWLDATELSVASAGLGVAPPTGFPLLCVLGRAAAMVPVGELGFRVALVSAAAASLAVLWITRLSLELGAEEPHGVIGAAIAGALVALSAGLARHGTVASPHALNAAVMAGSLLLLLRVARGAGARRGLALAAVCGLGMVSHLSFGLVALAALALFAVRFYRGARWPLLAPLMMLLVAAGLDAYLPVRAARAGAEVAAVADAGGHDSAQMSGASPDHLGGLAAHAVGWTSRPASADLAVVTAARGQGGAELVEHVADQVGPFAILAAAFGLLWLARQRRTRWLAGAVLVLGLGDLGLGAWFGAGALAGGSAGIPLALAAAVCAGAGVAWLSRYLGRAGPFAGAVVGVLVLVPPGLLAGAEVWPASAPGGAPELPRAWAEAALAAPPRAVVVVPDRVEAAGLEYLRGVERARPDLTLRWGAIEASATLASATSASATLAPAALAPAIRSAEVGAGADGSPLDAATRSLRAIFVGPGARDRHARRVQAWALARLGRLAAHSGDHARAQALHEAARVLAGSAPASAPAHEQPRQPQE